MKVLVGSKNPVKIEATRQVFGYYFPELDVQGVDVDPGVPAQPINEVTFDGARNRALRLREQGNADYYVGIEGGIIHLYQRWFVFGVMCILDNNDRAGYGTTSLFEIPHTIAGQLSAGEELGDVVDLMMGQTNTKQGSGAIGHFTRGKMNRTEYYAPGVLCALVPFLNDRLFFD